MRAHNGTVLYDTSWIAIVDYTDQLAKKRRASSKQNQSNPTNIRKDRTVEKQGRMTVGASAPIHHCVPL